jgi:hypothetical protein
MNKPRPPHKELSTKKPLPFALPMLQTHLKLIKREAISNDELDEVKKIFQNDIEPE